MEKEYWEKSPFREESLFHSNFDKKQVKNRIQSNSDLSNQILYNDIEIGVVKFLFKIRNANKLKKTISYHPFVNPEGSVQWERVFIAGKIFPVLQILYSGDAADASKIVLSDSKSSSRFWQLGPDHKLYNNTYISIDDDKISIFLPQSYLVSVHRVVKISESANYPCFY